jgi:hypothetical protein
MLRWILEHLGIVVVIVLFLAQMVRAVMQSRSADAQRRATPDDGSEERRVREVQEQIKRQIAARRHEQAPSPTPPVLAPETPTRAPVPRPTTTQMPEPFGGPLGRMLEEMQRKAQQRVPVPTPPPAPVVERRNVGEIERQQRLANELKSVEESRLLVKRRAAHVAAELELVAQSEPALRTVAHDRLLGDLHDPQSLRRAILLREVLGTPVGLR